MSSNLPDMKHKHHAVYPKRWQYIIAAILLLSHYAVFQTDQCIKFAVLCFKLQVLLFIVFRMSVQYMVVYVGSCFYLKLVCSFVVTIHGVAVEILDAVQAFLINVINKDLTNES